MKKSTEEGGIACGLCSISLQQASLGFGIADLSHGILGIAVLISMIIKKENDEIYVKDGGKTSGYTSFVKNTHLWVLHLILASFILQTVLGMILCLGASNRNSFLCALWAVASVVTSPLTPITYCLLGLGRLFEWIAVGEFVLNMDKEELEYQNERGNGGASSQTLSSRIVKVKVDDTDNGDDIRILQ